MRACTEGRWWSPAAIAGVSGGGDGRDVFGVAPRVGRWWWSPASTRTTARSTPAVGGVRWLWASPVRAPVVKLKRGNDHMVDQWATGRVLEVEVE